MEQTPLVYLLVPLENRYGREVTCGVREYTRANRAWQLTVASPTAATLRTLANRKPDGIIGLFDTEALERQTKGLGRPAVSVSCGGRRALLPRVIPDNAGIGRLAAEYFLRRGFRQFAIGGKGTSFGFQLRCRAFVSAVKEAGFDCQFLREGRRLRSVRAMPKPMGVFACDDPTARRIVCACIRAGVLVPREIAVIGVDNDEAVCELAEVPLSSIDPAGRRVGFEAAALLDRLMDGQPLQRKCVLVPPAGLEVRSSSDVVAVPDEEVVSAMQYMHSHACDPMRVQDMLGVLKVSRRTLEKRFRTIFGRTLHDEIRRLQFERARDLLCGTDLKVPQVAERCGFRDPKRFTTLFRREFGSPPVAFRRDRRGGIAIM